MKRILLALALLAFAGASFANAQSSGPTPTNFVAAQATVGTTATLIVAYRQNRGSVTIANTGTSAVYLGPAGVTTATGLYLAAAGSPGSSITLTSSAAIYGVVASSTAVVTEAENF
jgi:hypothetical protein